MSPPTFVTGSQRSGTTITAVILASDHNLSFVDEAEFTPGVNYDDCVVHLPYALDGYVLLHHMYPSAHFIVVTRDKADIIRSMKRIHWCQDNVQDWEQFLDDYVDQRLQLIDNLARYIPNSVTLFPYKSLETHRLFVSNRDGFTVKQWKADTPRGPQYWPDNFQCISDYYARRSQVSPG